MKRFAVILLVVGLLVSSSSFGAEKVREGVGGFFLGLSSRNVESLNDRLRAEGYGTFPSTSFNFGGWGWGVRGNWVFGGSGSAFMNQENGQIAKATLSGGIGFFELGYKLEAARASQVVAFAGIGGGGYTLKLVPFDVEQDFTQILRHPRTGSEITGGQFLAKLGVQLDWIGPKLGKEKRTSVTVGVRLEYVLGLTSPVWKVEDVDLRNPPDLSLDGFLLSLAIGFKGTERRCD